MNQNRSLSHLTRAGVFLLLFVVCSIALGQEKVIRLRNERILTQPVARGLAAPAKADEASVSGLYLIQFSDHFQPQWQQALKLVRVDLLRYVPDDAFVVRVDKGLLSQIQALPFVRWVGPYQSKHKLDSRLAPNAGLVANIAPAHVRVLLAPRSAPADILAVRRLFLSMGRDSVTGAGQVLQGMIPAQKLTALTESHAVLWAEPAPKMRLNDEIASKIVGGDDLASGTRTLTQQLGFDGSGVAVAVADSGLNNGDAETMHPDLAGRVDAFFYYGQLTDAADEHSHGTHVAGIIAGNAATGEADENGYLYGLGVASGAHIIAQRMFDGVGGYEAPPTYETLTRDAQSAGAVIGSNSWGDDTQGRYDLSASEFDALVRDGNALRDGDQPYILEFSAGNAGPGLQTIGSPAVAKNVIATGASQNNRPDFLIYADGIGAMADFSSRGPCEDGRIKPDVTAPGTWISSLQSYSATDEFAWATISPNYQYQGGTSQAGPHVSGAAAVFVQYYRATHTNQTPSPAMVKAALINSAVEMDMVLNNAPNNEEGWGRVDLSQIIGSARGFDFTDQTVKLTTGGLYEKRILIQPGGESFKATLVYTDVAGFPAAIPALVNDLDIEVIAPDGHHYRGNQFEGGESIPDPAGSDYINNVEAVHLFMPVPGEYTVRIWARNVVADACNDTVAIDQDFALVVSGDIALPGTGIVTFDRPAYSAPDTIHLKLIDWNLAGQPSAQILLRSTTESAGETITLFASGTSGLFTGAVMTVQGVATLDGRLQVSNGDVIEAVYNDADPGMSRVFTSQADLVPPSIFDVAATNRYGKVLITWQTDEKADSQILYGTNGVLSSVVYSRTLDSLHSIELSGLVPGQTYQFIVVGTDSAGNRTTNNNSGAYFTFVPVEASPLLFIDSYTDVFFAVPPVSGYTDALDQSGYPYEIWDKALLGSPSLDDLRSFKGVIWRVSEFTESLTVDEAHSLVSYVEGGGSLMVASMEVLTRLEESGLTTNLQTLFQVKSYIADAGAAQLIGDDTDPITRNIDMTLDYLPYEDFFKEMMQMPADVSDTITPTTNAAPILYSAYGAIVGLRSPRVGQDRPGRLIFLSFPFDAIPTSGPAPNNRAALLRNILGFLVPMPGNATIALDNTAYTLPSQVMIEVEDAARRGQGQVSVNCFIADQPAVQLALLETSRAGLFRGSVTLVSNITQIGRIELPAHNGDPVRIEYLDASVNKTISVSATVETDKPLIMDVASEPGYVDAVVYWDTDKLTDALVQFGESPLLGRTAYSDTFETGHGVTLEQLQWDRTYYYQVVSRDRAGNLSIDDNNGKLYTFRTLLPLTTPWQDNMENGSTDWAVFDIDGTEKSWQYGTPSGFFSIGPAHSGNNVWSTDLNGASLSQQESYLISPAIILTGGNQATLRFWQNYDFIGAEGDIFEVGEILLITNISVEPLSLGSVSDFSGDWELAEFDLSPHLGKVVYVVWHYFLFSMDYLPRPGWMIDDVSIEVSTVPVGTVIVSNNLAQAHYTLAGPRSQTDQGLGLVITNAPPGQYSVIFANVPYFLTPSPQTNTLVAGGTALFLGNYTIEDANHNGIPDSWEQQFLGPNTNQPPSTDSDNDGLSNYAEFIAGTNPTNANSGLVVRYNPFSANTGGLIVPTMPGHAYRLLGSTNLPVWAPLSDWVRAAGNSMTFPVPTTNPAQLFRIEVRP